MLLVDDLLVPIRAALESKDYSQAEQALIDSLYSSEAISFWHKITRLPSAESVHHTLSFVSGFQFSEKEPTACINLQTRVLTLGAGFFLDTFQSFGDLLFVLLHERGHVLISMVYGSRMSEFQAFKFANLWEDLYINNTILYLIKSDLCERVYETKPKFLRSLLCQEFPKWVAENHEWLRFNLPARLSHLLRETALSTSFFTRTITYSEWMEIGILIEAALGADDDRKPTLGEIGSGDLLGDMNGLEDAPSPIRESTGSLQDGDDYAVGDHFGSSKRDEEGDEIPGRDVTPIPEIPPTLKSVLHSFAPTECPPEFAPLLAQLKLRNEIEDIVVESLVGDVLSRKQGEPFYEGKTATFERIHRRDAFLVAAGFDPVMWTIDIPVAKKALQLYIDVSGSMWSFLHVIMLIHRHLSEFVDSHFQFSTTVVRVDPGENRIYSTGGTSYQVVGEHILREGYREVIVLTDNTETISAAVRKKLKKQLDLLYLIQTQDSGKKNGFQELATKTITIPDLESDD